MGTQRKKRWRKEGRERGATQCRKVRYTLQEGEVQQGKPREGKRTIARRRACSADSWCRNCTSSCTDPTAACDTTSLWPRSSAASNSRCAVVLPPPSHAAASTSTVGCISGAGVVGDAREYSEGMPCTYLREVFEAGREEGAVSLRLVWSCGKGCG